MLLKTLCQGTVAGPVHWNFHFKARAWYFWKFCSHDDSIVTFTGVSQLVSFHNMLCLVLIIKYCMDAFRVGRRTVANDIKTNRSSIALINAKFGIPVVWKRRCSDSSSWSNSCTFFETIRKTFVGMKARCIAFCLGWKPFTRLKLH